MSDLVSIACRTRRRGPVRAYARRRLYPCPTVPKSAITASKSHNRLTPAIGKPLLTIQANTSVVNGKNMKPRIRRRMLWKARSR